MSLLPALTVFLVIGGLQFAHSEIPPAPDQPQCLLRGYPRTMHLLSSVPQNEDNNTIIYQAYYCHPSWKNKYCSNKTEFKRICTFNETNRVRSTLFQCNMTGLIWSLYPNLLDPRLPSKVTGNRLCMVISATNENGKSYSKKKCCSVMSKVQCTVIPKNTVKVEAADKGQISITLKTPSEYSDPMSKVIGYGIRYTGNNQSKIIRFNAFNRKSTAKRQYTIIIKNLFPYTLYSLEISCYFIQPSQHFSSPISIRTLPEAPYSPPIITGVKTVSRNNTMKTVKLNWKHPPKSKRNGIISKSVVHYWIQRNLSSSSWSDDGITLNINGSLTQAFIGGLNINNDYLVAINSCTVECSDQSAEYQIKREPNGPPPTPQASTGSFFSVVPVFIGLFVVLFLVMAIALGICFIVKRQKRKNAQVPRDILPNDIEVSQVTPDDDNESVGLFGDESSEYARPVSRLTSVESPNHQRASVLQNESDEDDLQNKPSSMEEIPLC